VRKPFFGRLNDLSNVPIDGRELGRIPSERRALWAPETIHRAREHDARALEPLRVH
jgi:hypothetical protein